MGHGWEGGMVNPFEHTTLESRLECELLTCLIMQAGTVISGDKPSSIFNYIPRRWGISADDADVMSVAIHATEVYKKLCESKGMGLEVVGVFDNKIALFAYNPSLIAELLLDDEKVSLLKSYGYDTSNTTTCINCVCARLNSFYVTRGARPISQDAHTSSLRLDIPCEFPHEIGILLGYPIEDVKGFIENAGRDAKCCGQWKVYSDPRDAKRRFEALKRSQDRCQKSFFSGVSLRELIESSYVA